MHGYEPVTRDEDGIIMEHPRFMTNNHIVVKPELECVLLVT